MWSEMEADLNLDKFPEGPDLTGGVMAQIEQLENGRRERAVKATMARRRTAPGTSWMHYGVAVGLTFLLLQFGVFENLANGINEFNGQLSTSVSAWFNPQGSHK
ncbi:hypothetical protein D3C73_803670 [compost metagenome]